jgi:hypothetical protein
MSKLIILILVLLSLSACSTRPIVIPDPIILPGPRLGAADSYARP